MQIKLRDYQSSSIEQIDNKFRDGKNRIILWAMAGAGKTTICAWMLNRSLDYKYPSIFIVRGRELVKNASETLDHYGIDHSINMAGHWRYNQEKTIQVNSIDTLKSRKNYPFVGMKPLIFLDECHKDYSEVFEIYPDAFIVGMTATPFGDNSMYDDFVQPIDAYELRDSGYLVPEKIYCPHIIDVTGVKKIRGDYDKKQLESVVTQSAIVGNIIEDWKRYGKDRPTVCFCVSIEHSIQMKQAFSDAGIPSMHCDASSDDKTRMLAKKGLEDGNIKVVCNVDIFSVGWNCPIVGCIIMARPTQSLIWMIQAEGRGLRSNPGKENCIIIDSAGNTFRFGTPYMIRSISFEKPGKRKSIPMENRVCTCEECFYIFDPEETDHCPECGWVKPKVIREVKQIDGELVEYSENAEDRKQRLFEMMRKDYYKLEWVRKTKKLKDDWTFIQLKKKYAEVYHMMDKITYMPKSIS